VAGYGREGAARAEIVSFEPIDSGAARRQVKPRFSKSDPEVAVAKSELSTKRLCGSCGAKFYDLSKDPIVCPKCDTVFHPVVYTSTRGRAAEAARAAPVAPLAPEAAEAPENADVEMVSLEEADAEGGGKSSSKKQGTADVDVSEDDDVEVADDGAEDDTFLETDEDEGDDVSDIVGGDREDEEDT
jgi:uncharacterized protein (TIGR02300 family)